MKLYGTELALRIARFAGEVIGWYGLLTGGAATPLADRVARASLTAPVLKAIS